MKKIAYVLITLMLALAVVSSGAYALHQKNSITNLHKRVNMLNTFSQGSDSNNTKNFLMWSQDFVQGQPIDFISGEFGVRDGFPFMEGSQWHRGPRGKLTRTADLVGTFDPVAKTFQGNITVTDGQPTTFEGSYSHREDGFIDWVATLLDESGRGLVF